MGRSSYRRIGCGNFILLKGDGWPHDLNPRLGLTELLIVLAIIGILAAILIPVLHQVREKARQTACISNERQLGVAFLMYAHDNDDTIPASDGWAGKIYPYTKSPGVFHCPSDATAAIPPYYSVSYGVNGNLVLINYNVPPWKSPVWTNNRQWGSVASPAKVVLLFEVVHSVAQITTTNEGMCGPPPPRFGSVFGNGLGYIDADVCHANGPFKVNVLYATGAMDSFKTHGPYDHDEYDGDGRHQGGANFLLADGHARWLAPQQVSTGGDAPTPESEPNNKPGQDGLLNAAGSENAHFAATFSRI